MSSFSLAMVCEAPADHRTAGTLVDRILCEKIEWFTQETLEHLRHWVQFGSNERFLLWRRVREEAARRDLHGPRIFGKFGGEAGKPDAFSARRALLVMAQMKPPPDAVLLIRDSDGDAERREGLKQARAESAWPFEIIVGVAEPKRECWILAVFEASTPEEQTHLEDLRKELRFDPVARAERLDSQQKGSLRDAKRVLEKLTGGSHARERECLLNPSLKSLEKRGKRVGLTAFLEEVCSTLVPLLRGDTPSAPP